MLTPSRYLIPVLGFTICNKYQFLPNSPPYCYRQSLCSSGEKFPFPPVPGIWPSSRIKVLTVVIYCLYTDNQKYTILSNSRNQSINQFIIKARIHLKAVFTPPKIGLTEISRSRFKQYKNPTLITQINVLGCFVNFLVIFRYIWEERVFLKRVVKFGEIRNS